MKELDIVKQVIKKAGEKTLEFYNLDEKELDIVQKDSKSEDSPLTKADLASEKIILEGLKHFNYGILSEETDEENDRLNQEYVWIIDPLDGTKDFINKTGDYSIMIGLAQKGQIILGVVYQPTTDTYYYAIKNESAYKQVGDNPSQKLQVTQIDDFHDTRMLSSRFHISDFETDFSTKTGIKDFVKSGSAGLKICKIAAGQAEIYISPTDKTGEWDIAAGQIIIEEAGGVLTGMNGKKYTFNKEKPNNQFGIVATNKLIHEKIIHQL